MIKNWNQVAELKRNGKIVKITLDRTESYDPDIQLWRKLSGVIKANFGEYGTRPKEQVAGSFQLTLGRETAIITIYPRRTQFKEHHKIYAYPENTQPTLEWIRERIADLYAEFYDKEPSK